MILRSLRGDIVIVGWLGRRGNGRKGIFMLRERERVVMVCHGERNLRRMMR